MKKAIHTTKAPAAIGPYSQAILVNGFLYTAGQVALIPETGGLDMQSVKTETKRVMENLKAILTEAEMDFTHVVKTSIFLSSMDLFVEVNSIYGSYFPEGSILPARETVAVAGLPKGVNVEISVVAFKG
ncbi:MAG: Rid family detoxifying hydrolase [Flavobacteriales bacterium]|jgi:2-iminobutanoate/2-iminopropanoate deaminase|nr:Rid family detoxifying hydrolase [Flavobacteriales bacterium]